MSESHELSDPGEDARAKGKPFRDGQARLSTRGIDQERVNHREGRRRDPDREREYRRTAMERRGDEIRAYKRQWRERNKEHIREYHRRYHEEFRDHENARNRAYARRRAAEERRQRERVERRRTNSRRYYEANRERIAMATRAWRERQKIKDPERYLAQRRESNKRWRDKNKDRENAKLRAHYRDHAPELRDKAREYYAANRERILAQRKAARQAAPERSRERQRRYRDRERRRLDAGLPPYRRHRSSAAERAVHRADAEEFFVGSLSSERLEANRKGLPTPPELIARWERDCARARAAHFLAVEQEARGRLTAHVASRTVDQLVRDQAVEVRAAEDVRMEDIARRINSQLRTRRRRAPTPDPAAPHTTGGSPQSGGLTR